MFVQWTVLDSESQSAMLMRMQLRSVGSFLSDLRRSKRKSLQHVAKRIGKKGISKQALSLIERGRMRVPKARLDLLKSAYRMSLAEEKELARLYAFETMIEHTAEDREFAEAILSVIDPKTRSSIYILGGRKLALTSPVLQKKAAEFLEGEGKAIVFFYPKVDARNTVDVSLWHHNTERERNEIRRSIQSFSAKPIARRIRFVEIDTGMTQTSPIAWQVVSLCGPFTSTTIASSGAIGDVAGYVYVEGPRDRWVLLRTEQAQRAATVLESALEIAGRGHGPIREQTNR